MIPDRYRTLLLATGMFNLGFVVWFSFAPFTEGIAQEFGLSVAQLGVVASSAVVAVPLGRIVVGPLTDRYGAPVIACGTLTVVGTFAIVSAFAQTYEVFVAARVVASMAGVTFVIGIQHVSEWFDEEHLGLAEGIYAGIGNAGAGLGAYFTLPRIFGAEYAGPLFATNWRAAFFYTGALAIGFGVLYLLLGQAARSEAKRAATREGVSLRGWLYVATRHGAVVLSAAYVMTFGLELAMNGWLGTYYREAFGQGDLVFAATLAATFSIAAGLLRPVGGYVSDLLVRHERSVLPWFGDRYREQWTFATLVLVVCSTCGMTAAGLAGDLRLAVLATFLVGASCGFASAAIFAQVPALFPDDSGAVAGIVGGVGSSGGSVYPLLFAAPFLPNLHVGYAVAAATMIPIVGLCAWLFQPHVAERAASRGWLLEAPGRGEQGIAASDD